MSDRCSCVDGPNYRCGAGRPCDVHGSVEALMAWGEYVDRQGRTWWRDDVHKDWVRAPLTAVSHSLSPAQMRRRIEREQHRDMCPGLKWCDDHPVPHVLSVSWWYEPAYQVYSRHGGQAQPHEYTFAEAIDAAQQQAKETA